MIGAVHVANAILKRAKRDNISIKPIKLYYLIYLLYSNVLYKDGTKLFNEPFSVTEIGPVVPTIYFKFNSYRDDKINSYATNALGKAYIVNGSPFDLYLEEIWIKYNNYSETDLYELITSVDSAFYKAKKVNSILKDQDILNDEIIRNENVLKRAKILKNNIN